MEVKTLFFSLSMRGKNQSFEWLLKGQRPSWYTGPWALFGDVDTSEKKQMIGKAP